MQDKGDEKLSANPRPAGSLSKGNIRISGSHDPRYFDLSYFPLAKPGQTWFEAREEQVRAINQRLRQCHIKDSSRVAGSRQGGAAAFPALIPPRPYCADIFDHGLKIRPREYALRYRHVQFNGPNMIDWLSFDVDKVDAYRAAEDASLPSPTVISINPANGHGLLSYLLQHPIQRFDSSRRKPIEWIADIQRGYTRRLGADPRFDGVVRKNPLHSAWRTAWHVGQPYSLEQLDCALTRIDKRRERKQAMEFGEGRNCALFERLRALCYAEVRNYFDDEAAFKRRALDLAMGLNAFDNPLPKQEVSAIARSVTKWIYRNFSAAKFSDLQRHRANCRWSGSGHVSAEDTEPWKSLKISRATYYRRRRRGLVP